jgi:CubicO group peptidase (beta-lactamase class C family)
MRRIYGCSQFAGVMLTALVLALVPADGQENVAFRKTLEPFIDKHEVAGMVTLVADAEKILELDAVGYANVAGKVPMKVDGIFWIASMSKPITGVLLMMLADEGKLKVDDPVEKYLPEFKGQKLKRKGSSELVNPARPMTIKDLLTHTSGIIPHQALSPVPRLDMVSLRDQCLLYAREPLQSEPGTEYKYSNAGINTVGRVVEVVAGMPFEEFLAQRLLRPLGMKDTTFWPTGAQLKRLVTPYKAGPDSKGLAAATLGLTQPLDDPKRQAFPAGGLFSTATDLAQFCRMMLADGVFAGKRYLSAAAVKQMTSNQTGAIKVAGGDLVRGLSWLINNKTGGYGHGGAYATYMWIEPAKHLAMIYLVQQAGPFPGDGGKSRPAFQRLAEQTFGK